MPGARVRANTVTTKRYWRDDVVDIQVQYF